MGQSSSLYNEVKIQILHLGVNDLKSDYPIQARLYTYPERGLTLIAQQKQPENRLQAGSRSRVQQIIFQADSNDSVTINLPIFGYLSQDLLNQINQIQIREALTDQLFVDKLVYVTLNSSITIRTFSSITDPTFLNILFQTHIHTKVAELQSPYLHKMQKYFCIAPTNHLINHYSQVIFYEPIQTSLSMIIKTKREEKQVWTLVEFYSLMSNLVEAVSTLHQQGYTHNDIRPSNIYYSTKKSCFLLGSFQNLAFCGSGDQTTGDGSKPIKNNGFKKTINQVNIADTLKNDVYALGMTLLSAFYLHEPISRQKCAPHNRFLIAEYPIIKLIKMMIASHQKQASIFEIKQAMAEFQRNSRLPVEPLHATYEGLQQFVDITKRERYIADGYKLLGLIKQWKERLDNRYTQRALSEQSVEAAKYFQELAIISNIEGKLQKSSNYYIRSAELYQNLGSINFKQRDYERSINYLQSGLQNFKLVDSKQTNLTFLKLVVSLVEAKILSGYQLIDSQHLQLVQSKIESIRQIQPFAYCVFLTQFINIYKYYQNYEKVDKILRKQLACAGHVQTIVDEITISKQIIQNNLKIIQSQKMENQPQEKLKLLSQTQLQVLTILNDKEYYFMERPVKRFDMLRIHAKIKIIKGFTTAGIKQLEDLLVKLNVWMDSVQESKYTQEKNHFLLLKCQVLEYIGQIYFNQNQLDMSMDYQKKALQHYIDYFGDIYNIQCARVLENIGDIHKMQKYHAGYADCLELVTKIFKMEYSKYHKDVLRLTREHKIIQKNSFNMSRRGSFFQMDTDLFNFPEI